MKNNTISFNSIPGTNKIILSPEELQEIELINSKKQEKQIGFSKEDLEMMTFGTSNNKIHLTPEELRRVHEVQEVKKRQLKLDSAKRNYQMPENYKPQQDIDFLKDIFVKLTLDKIGAIKKIKDNKNLKLLEDKFPFFVEIYVEHAYEKNKITKEYYNELKSSLEELKNFRDLINGGISLNRVDKNSKKDNDTEKFGLERAEDESKKAAYIKRFIKYKINQIINAAAIPDIRPYYETDIEEKEAI